MKVLVWFADAPPPTWEQLEKGLVAVKTVVHGLVDFIQNHSKKGADPQQVSPQVASPLVVPKWSESYGTWVHVEQVPRHGTTYRKTNINIAI